MDRCDGVCFFERTSLHSAAILQTHYISPFHVRICLFALAGLALAGLALVSSFEIYLFPFISFKPMSCFTTCHDTLATSDYLLFILTYLIFIFISIDGSYILRPSIA